MLLPPSRRSLLALGAGLAAPLLAATLLAAALSPRGQEPASALYPRTIVLVRHAEKQKTEDGDPALSEAGAARARALARHLEHAGVTQLFASEYKRTQETLTPLSEKTGVKLVIVPAKDSSALLDALSRLPARSVAVVAGHSNTIPALSAALAGGGRPAGELGEGDYDRLLIVTQWSETGGNVLELRY